MSATTATVPAAPAITSTPREGRKAPGALVLGVAVVVMLAVVGITYYVMGGGLSFGSTAASLGPGATVVAPAGQVSAACKVALTPLYDELQELNSRLNVGLNLGDYGERVGDASVAYGQLEAASLDSACLDLGAKLEDALNAYIRANTTWNDCVTDTDCDNDSITPKLQAEWATATNLLGGVRAQLK
jgi:hypothetical protein